MSNLGNIFKCPLIRYTLHELLAQSLKTLFGCGGHDVVAVVEGISKRLRKFKLAAFSHFPCIRLQLNREELPIALSPLRGYAEEPRHKSRAQPAPRSRDLLVTVAETRDLKGHVMCRCLF